MNSEKVVKTKVVYKVVADGRKSIFVSSSETHFVKYYYKDTIVEASPNTLGIFCFDSISNAENFIEYYSINFYATTTSILKVKPIGRKKVPKFIAVTGDNSKEFYSILDNIKRKKTHNFTNDLIIGNCAKYNNIEYKKPPVGTVCYPAVKVLE